MNTKDIDIERRKKVNKKVFKFGCLPILILFIILLIIVPSKDDKQPEIKKEKLESINQNNIDYKGFKYLFGEKDKYSVDVKIDSIRFERINNSFKLQKDDYSVPESVDGLILSIDFTLTNSNQNELLVPIPEYYFISEPNDKYFSETTTYSRSCSCTIDNSTDVTFNGKELWNFTKTQDQYKNYTFLFNPSESKSFTVNFTDPFVANINEIIFSGFDLEWNSPDYTRPRDVGFIINTKTSKIIGVKKF